MKIDILQKTIDTDKCDNVYFESCYNSVLDVNYCCDGAKALFENRVLDICYGSYNNAFNNDPDFDEEVPIPFVGIVKTDMVDNGYESFDGEDEYWVDNYEEEDSYYKIEKCPICGKDIVINVTKKDITEDVNNLLRMRPKGRKTVVDKNKRKDINKQISELIGKNFQS